ncbi:hypothetical protein [Microlunatus speluncae]|uniref:CIS tube protein n=1 Tax=Microlunatus speluncae TaxID=2594267 RepID=UPI001C2DEA76|nr:hypothetical protein [Microlunatus speluncae]
MEKVAFLVDETGERIDCLLNPESFEVSRLAGVRPRGTASGRLVGTGLADDPLQFTGGGRTTLVLDLLFDVDFVEEGKVRPTDVRTLTRRLWMLAENSAEEAGSVRPPLVRLVWGKTWNVPGVIIAVAERFDVFDPFGTPQRSWLRMKLARVAESAAAAQESFEAELAKAGPTTNPALGGGAVPAIGDGSSEGGYAGVRLDQLACDGLGSPFQWRLLADYNDIANPLEVAAGTVLAIPPLTGGAQPAGGQATETPAPPIIGSQQPAPGGGTQP